MLVAAVASFAATACDAGRPEPRPAPAVPPTKASISQSAPVIATSGESILEEADGKPRRIVFSNGTVVTIEPLRITGRKPGVVGECALRIGGHQIATIGSAGSSTEALICHRLVDAGPLSISDGKRRLGLIYEAGSPSVEYRAPVVLIEGTADAWTVDDTASERFDGADPALSIISMAKTLGRPR